MRRSSLALVAWSFALLSTSACTNTELTNRYDTACFAATSKRLVRVTAFSQEPPKTPAQARTVFDLDREGQAALIQALAGAGGTPEAVLNGLARAITPEERRAGLIDRTRIKRRVVVAVQPTESVKEPGDRIERLSFDLTLADNFAKFTSWDRFVSEYGTVDLGKVTFDKQHEFSAGVSGGPDPTETIPVSVEAKYTGKRSLTEELSLRQRYVALAGALTSEKATVWQQGVTGIDLSGTFAVDLEVLVGDGLPDATQFLVFSALLRSNAPVPPNDVSVQVVLMHHHPARAVKATVGGNFRLRHILDGADSVVEGDDDVRFLSGSVEVASPILELASARDLEARAWRIRHRVTDANGRVVTRHLVLDGYGLINFLTFEEARAFLEWLRKLSTPPAPVEFRVADKRLDLTDAPLTDGERAGLQIETYVVNAPPTQP